MLFTTLNTDYGYFQLRYMKMRNGNNRIHNTNIRRNCEIQYATDNHYLKPYNNVPLQNAKYLSKMLSIHDEYQQGQNQTKQLTSETLRDIEKAPRLQEQCTIVPTITAL
jgi:hypothetical protein